MAAGRPLMASALLMLAFGSVHAFSLFLAPLEQATGASRASVSLVYGLALGALTLAVLGARPLLARYGAARLAVAACLIAALGLGVASKAPPLLLTQVGYGVLFGGANGIAYASCLVIAGGVARAGSGFWLGAVTATYALGAALAAVLLGLALPVVGWQGSLIALAGLFMVLGAGAGLLLHGLMMGVQVVPGAAAQRTGLWRHWLAYGASVAAGLMVLGHAAAMVDAAAGTPGLGAAATVLAGLANALGGLAAAVAVDRTTAARLLGATSGLSIAGLALLLGGGTVASVAGIGLVALAYGAHIAAFPVAIRSTFGAECFAWAYGRVFTAWGVAGIATPWLAGALYAPEPGYRWALTAALVAAVFGLAFNLTLAPDIHGPTTGVSHE